MKVTTMLRAAVMTCLAVGTQHLSHASVVSPTNYSLSQIEGNWEWGRTNWNALFELGPVNNVSDLGAVQSLLSDGYTPLSYSDTGLKNGIYTDYLTPVGALDFTLNGGADYTLNSLTFLSSRSYSNATPIQLQYSLDGGAWQTAVSTTSGALGMTGGSANNYTLSFGGVTADAFRLSFGGGDQVSIHEITVDGQSLAIAPVPEPCTALFGTALLGVCAMSRRRSRTAP